MGQLAAHWWVILIIVVLLFGAPKLPALARSMGQSLRIFKSEIKNNDEKPADDGSSPTNSSGISSSAINSERADSSTANLAKPGDTTSKP